MRISTYIDIYYNHRLEKANILKKIYIYLIIPFNYFIEKINYPKKINLDEYAKVNKNGKLELVNELGINLGLNPEEILDNLQNQNYLRISHCN